MAIFGEIIAQRTGREGRSLRSSSGPIRRGYERLSGAQAGERLASARASATLRMRAMCAAIAASRAGASPDAIASTIAWCSSIVRGARRQPHGVGAALGAERARRRPQVLEQRVGRGPHDPLVQLDVEPEHRVGVLDAASCRARRSRAARPPPPRSRARRPARRRPARAAAGPRTGAPARPSASERHELQRAQQLLDAQRRDERPGAVAALEDVHRLQRADRLPHRRAADAERLGQAPLGRQPLARLQPAVEDHVLDRPDRLRDVGAGGPAAGTASSLTSLRRARRTRASARRGAGSRRRSRRA